MPRFRIDVDRIGPDQVGGALPTARDVLEPVARKLLTLIRLGFKFSKSPWGETWEPLKLRSGQPLRDKGHLRDSIVPAYGPDYVDIGTNHVGAKVHQFGATIRPVRAKALRFFAEGSNIPIFRQQVTIPARPYLPLDNSGNLVLPATWEKSFLSTIRAAIEGKKPPPGGA